MNVRIVQNLSIFCYFFPLALCNNNILWVSSIFSELVGSPWVVSRVCPAVHCSGQAGKAGQVRAAHKSPILTLTLRCVSPHLLKSCIQFKLLEPLIISFNCTKRNFLMPPCWRWVVAIFLLWTVSEGLEIADDAMNIQKGGGQGDVTDQNDHHNTDVNWS